MEILYDKSKDNYWNYRDYLEKTGYFLYLKPEQQARFVDGFCVDYCMDFKWQNSQLKMAKQDLQDFDKNPYWNASGIGSLAFSYIFGHPLYRNEWQNIYSQYLDKCRNNFSIDEKIQKDLQNYIVDHDTFSEITQELVNAHPKKFF